MSPFNDFLVESKKTMKGTSKATSIQLSKEIFLGNELLAIYMILGVLGIQEATLYVTVSTVVPIITTVVNKDRIEKVGKPNTPLLSLLSNTI